jgi:hypothetical protein
MPNDRTMVTELATALGTLPYTNVGDALADRPAALHVGPSIWAQLDGLHRDGRFAESFAVAFDNGKELLCAPDGLCGRTPRIIEWTGGRRPPGDEVAPVDLRIDHVYLVSCKYLSENISSPSPARLFDGLLATSSGWDRGDWYETVAPEQYQALYRACVGASGCTSLPQRASDMTSDQRRQLRRALPGRAYPPEAREPYQALCDVVSVRSAQRWNDRLAHEDSERMLWRLLRIGNAPYFLLGADGHRTVTMRIGTPWDWRQEFTLRTLEIGPAIAGQPRVDWRAIYVDRATRAKRSILGHVEIRWSHGKFAQPPEAKVYLDTPTDEVPGYYALWPASPRQLALFPALLTSRGEPDTTPY